MVDEVGESGVQETRLVESATGLALRKRNHGKFLFPEWQAVHDALGGACASPRPATTTLDSALPLLSPSQPLSSSSPAKHTTQPMSFLGRGSAPSAGGVNHERVDMATQE